MGLKHTKAVLCAHTHTCRVGCEAWVCAALAASSKLSNWPRWAVSRFPLLYGTACAGGPQQGEEQPGAARRPVPCKRQQRTPRRPLLVWCDLPLPWLLPCVAPWGTEGWCRGVLASPALVFRAVV